LSVPPPTTFAEGQRKLYGIAAAAAGVCFGLAVVVGATIVAFGDWGKDQLHFQLIILFALLGAGTLNTTIVIIGLLLGGPVGKFSGKLSDGQRSAEINAEASDK
jgi:hypothetical protein